MGTIDELRGLLGTAGLQADTGPGGEMLLVANRIRFIVQHQELDAYLAIRGVCQLAPETALQGHGMFEQVVDMRLAPYAGPARLFMRDEENFSMEKIDGSVRIELSDPSACFTLAVIDKCTSEQWRSIRRFALRPAAYRTGGEAIDRPLREFLGRLLTIKVIPNPGATLSSDALHSLAHAALFNISYARGVALNVLRAWERPFFRLRARRERDVAFPVRKYHRDLVAYYQLALSNESLILAYLSLYKIIEFFYVSTAEKVLHTRLSDRMAMPTFSAQKTRDLRDIADLVRRFDRKMNEPQMLTSVLSHYLMADEIRTWVEDFETDDGLYFTASQEVLGEKLTLNLHEEHVFSSLAQRIYHIRNALVHNKEGDLPRFVPFSGQEELLSKETPLLLFVAEQVIIKSADDLSGR